MPKRIITGLVTSDKMEKTIVVRVERQVKHPVTKKMVRKSKKFKAHDEENSANIGDTVEIIESRPLSKDVRWNLSKIAKRNVLGSAKDGSIKKDVEGGTPK